MSAKVSVEKDLGEFSIGHRLMNHNGVCSRTHGHSYKVKIRVTGPLNIDGMVIDFAELKKLKEVPEKFDHRMVLYRDDPIAKLLWKDFRTHLVLLEFHPTVENLAVHWLREMEKILDGNHTTAKISRIVVNETATSSATVNVE